MQSSPTLLALALALSPAPALAADVLVVDASGGPGADATTIEAALALAQDGDIVLVRSGDYSLPSIPPVTVDGRGLVLVADGAASIHGAIDVSGLATDRSFTVRGFTSSDDFALGSEGIAGAIWLEDVELSATFGQPVAEYCDHTDSRVVMVRCTAFGAITSLDDAQLHAFDSDFLGESLGHPSSNDLPLVLQNGSFAYASGSRFVSSFPGIIEDVLAGDVSSARLLDCELDDVLGDVTTLPGVARSYRADAVVREGLPLALSVSGPPGEGVYVLVSTRPAGLFVPSLSGSLVLGPVAGSPVFLGAIPPSGTLALNVTAPTLSPGTEAVAYWSQAVLRSPGGALHLASGTVTVVVDDAL